MRRIFWDTMLLIYLLEQNRTYGNAVVASLAVSLKRGDRLCTSWLAFGEVMAGTEKYGSSETVEIAQSALATLPFDKLSFDARCVEPFSRLRSQRIAAPDALHLACAASAEVDLFLTNDKALHRLHVPGIKFIGGLDSGIL